MIHNRYLVPTEAENKIWQQKGQEKSDDALNKYDFL
jgi:hypothetical protein